MNRVPPLLFFATAVLGQNAGYVVDNAGGQVQVIDLANRRVTASIPTGANAAELLILPDNQTALVSNAGSGDVAILDLRTNTVAATIPTGQSPGGLSATPDGRFVYVADDAANEVAVIDVRARKVAARIPVGTTPIQVNIEPNGRYAYVVNQEDTPSGTISVIDVNRNAVAKTLEVGMRPNQFAILPGLRTAYVVNTGSDNLTLVDMNTNQAAGTIGAGRGPVGVAFSSDSRWLYVVNRDSNSVSVIDTQSNSVVTEIPVGAQPSAMVVTFDSRFGFVSNTGGGTVTLLDLARNTAELDIPVGSGPFSLMLDPDENFLYVANLNSSSLSVVDVNADRVAATIPVSGVPVQFTMLNAPTLLEVAPNPALGGTRVVLNGEGFLPASVVRFVTTSPPRTILAQSTFLDSQGLEAAVPVFQGSNVVVSVANPDANSSEQVTLRSGTATPAIFPGGVVEGAGFARAPSPVSGNAIVSVFGQFPGAVDQDAPAYLFPLPVELGNARARFNGVDAPLFAVRGGQINAAAPARLFALDSVRVTVTVANQTSPAETVAVAPASPGIFFNFVDGAGAFLHSDYTPVTAANPARRGEPLLAYAGGLGDTTPTPVEGDKPPEDILAWTAAVPAVIVGGVNAEVLFHGLAPCCTGLYQVNFVVPDTAPTGGEVPVTVAVGGRISNSVKLAVQ
jgi:uncharacterized protein (TIGR03437 family)